MAQVGILASTSDVEPQWEWVGALQAYSRPLLGSELVKERMHMFSEGAPEPCHGFTFQTTCSSADLIKHLHDAMGHLRFVTPLIAASIEDDYHDSEKRAWVYRPPSGIQEIEAWIQQTLLVYETETSDEEFIAAINQKRMPIKDGHFTKVFECHLLLRKSGIHSLFIHGSHALLDPQATLAVFREVFDYISHPTSSPSAIADLPWGEEWRNLPAGPITSAGGIRDGADVAVPSLLQEVRRIVTRDKPSEALQAQRAEIRQQGLPVRTHGVIPAAKFEALKAALKQLDLSLTVLLEAAFVLTTFANNARQGTLSEDANVLLDMTMIPLNPLFIGPHNPRVRVGASLAYAPLAIDFRDVPKDAVSREALISVMQSLQAQYRRWLASPHLPFLSYQMMFPSSPNPSAIVVADMGVIEDHVPSQWPREAKKPTLELLDMTLGHRLSAFTRPVCHAWSLNNELHVQIAASDIWDKKVLVNFLHESLDLALLLSQDIAPIPKQVHARRVPAQSCATEPVHEPRPGFVGNWGRRMARLLGITRIA